MATQIQAPIINEHGILIDLDSIIDTRLGTLSKMKGEIAHLFNARYVTRLTDEFNLLDDSINLEEYKKAYENRDIESIGRGIPTTLLTEFGAMLDIHLDEILGPNPENKSVFIEINVYPYKLEPNECEDIIACFREWTGTPFDIKVVNIPIESFTMPLITQRKWSVIFTYDFEKFQYYTFVKNAKQGHVGSPQVSLFVPKLASSLEKLRESAELTLPGGEKLDSFEFLRVHYGPLIGLEFLPAEKFSGYYSGD